MPQFIICLPINVSENETFNVTETIAIDANCTNVIIPGCNVKFNVFRKPHTSELSEIFNSHMQLSTENKDALDAHKSLLFLTGEINSITDVEQINLALLKLISKGAIGVYMQQSGTAYIANDFREQVYDNEYPLDPWINFIEMENSIYTLGLATFKIPDLCIESNENATETLLLAADAIFGDHIPAKSGKTIDIDETVYVLRMELKSPFAKDSPEYNSQGILRLKKAK